MTDLFDDPAIAALARLHEGLERKGPGSDELTRAIVGKLQPHLPPSPAIVDMGCGSGHAALLLAEVLDGTAIGIDLYPPFIAELEARRAGHPAGARVSGRVADMADPGLAPGCCDLIWSEGAVYLMGVDPALERWKTLLRPGGFLVFSDCCWLVGAPPDEIAAYFGQGYPGMRGPASTLKAAEAAGWRFVLAQSLPAAAWWPSYYNALSAHMAAIEPGLAKDDPLHAVIADTKVEQDKLRRFGDSFSYVFYVLQKPG